MKNINFSRPIVKWWVSVIVTVWLIVCACTYSFMVQAVRSGSVHEGFIWAIWTFNFLIFCWIVQLTFSLLRQRYATFEKLDADLEERWRLARDANTINKAAADTWKHKAEQALVKLRDANGLLREIQSEHRGKLGFMHSSIREHLAHCNPEEVK